MDPELDEIKRTSYYSNDLKEDIRMRNIDLRADEIMQKEMWRVEEELKRQDLWDDFLIDLGGLGYHIDYASKGLDVRTIIRTIALQLAKEDV